MPILASSSDPGELATPEDLVNYAGAPFAPDVVSAAAESVRAEAGWHIAPVVTETMAGVSQGGTVLLIPSLRYTVTAVRDVTASPAETITDYVDRGSGILHRDRGWVTGHRYEVDATHGYAGCPPALLPVIAHRASAMRSPAGGNVRLGSLSLGSTGGAEGEQDAAIVARYSLR